VTRAAAHSFADVCPTTWLAAGRRGRFRDMPADTALPLPTAASAARHPWVWAVLYFPYGLTIGFPSIALSYLGRRAGVPVAAIAGAVFATASPRIRGAALAGALE
jgi:hypothetical protein